jgi:hypothetical protein
MNLLMPVRDDRFLRSRLCIGTLPFRAATIGSGA